MPPRPLPAAVLCLVWLLLCTAGAAAAPPLSDRVPGDALVYVGWSGADACPGYDASHLKAVIASSTLPQVFTSFVPQVVRKVGKLSGQAQAVLDQLVSAGSPAWHHPTAFYFGGVDYAGPKPMPKLALMCDAGPDATALADQLNRLVADLPPDADPKPVVKTFGGLVVVSLGAAMPAGPGAGTMLESLATNPKFTAAMAQCKPDGAAMVGYVDAEAVVAAADDGVQRSGDRDAADNWPKVRDVLGLNGFRRVALTAGFDGKDWVERTFASTNGQHDGLLALLDARPLDADLLAVVPRSADRVAATRLDLAAGFDAVHDAIGKFSPDAAAKADEQIQKVNGQAGLDVRRDLLGSLGDQWVAYSDRSIGGSSITGSVLVNRLRDPARCDSALTQLSRRLNFLIARKLDHPDIEIRFLESTAGGTTLHYLAVPLITPTWAVKDGYLYVGLYPQVVVGAIDAADRHGPSILQRPELAQLMKRLGNHPAASLQFTDLPDVAPDGYAGLLGESRLLLGIGDIFGAHPPILVVPPLRQVLDQLEPSGSVTWADATGWHAEAISPFPGAELLSGGSAGGGESLSQLPGLLQLFGRGSLPFGINADK